MFLESHVTVPGASCDVEKAASIAIQRKKASKTLKGHPKRPIFNFTQAC